MIYAILINLLGISTFYLFRYINRRNKSNSSLKFWIKDNWPELLATLLINIALMIFLLHPRTDVEEYLYSKLPQGIVVPVQLVASYSIGMIVAWRLYVRINGVINKKYGQDPS